uniref:X-box-binding protein 1 n=1 Tax=Ciona intestinalis TaxID=7719 RepID=Q4H2M0_CIOIN|nr:transcription factor protein [Ciona intestinalis]BAE06757.1 transcription factor protein [Ciona intestinalis]|eukprot:NP_001071850.1 transcription factor protein [Ciona intestinalis]
MPFSNVKVMMPVLPKPDHASSGRMQENIPLSAIEDKELRKKLRNRQSALAARERKKARMMELEKQVAELQETNRRMEDENQHLRARLDNIIQRCLRAGFPLDGSADTAWMRVNAEAQGYSRRQVGYAHPTAAGQSLQNQQLRMAQPTGESTTEASLKCAIRALGERQHEILQTITSGIMAPIQPAAAKYDAQLCYQQQSFKVSPAQSPVTVKQEYGTSSQTYSPQNQETVPLPQSSCSAESPVISNGTNRLLEPAHSSPCKRDWLTANQTLPSIGAMLAPSAKRPCSRSNEHQPVDNTELEKCSPTNNVGFLMRSENPPRPVNVINSINSPPTVITSNPQNEKVKSPQSYHEPTENTISSCSPSPLLTQGEDFLAGEFDNIIEEENTNQCGLTIFDIEEIIRGDSCADSPSARSGSDSGLSMDESLDWIADNPIFNF